MCFLCDRAKAYQFQSGASGAGRALNGLSIAPVELIDELGVAATRQLTATDGVLDFYMHAPGGAVTVAGGGFGQQVIDSMPIPMEDQAFFRSVVEKLDAVIDLDFREVGTPAEADVDLFYDRSIDVGGAGITLGLAALTGGEGWELFLNLPALALDENLRRYALIHELGHALGLEHPFDTSDGDAVKGISDPGNSSFPEETVMAYRAPLDGVWPEFFTLNDLNALTQIWGANEYMPAEVNGLSLKSFGAAQNSLSGQDIKDYFNGNAGDDLVTGSLLGDVLRGGSDDDEVRGLAGDDWLFGDLGDDVIRGGVGGDYIDGGRGGDQLWGGLGADVFRLSAGADSIFDFSAEEGDRLELSNGSPYHLDQGLEGMQVFTPAGVTTLIGVTLSSFDSASITLV